MEAQIQIKSNVKPIANYVILPLFSVTFSY